MNRLFASVLVLALFSGVFAAPQDLICANKPYDSGIWTMSADGSNLKEVSDFGWFGAFSAGGEKIAFGSGYNTSIWIMNSDGSNKQKISSSGGAPSWSPDGNRLTYFTGSGSATSRRIWVINADGSNPVQITTAPGDFPKWSNYSDKIVFDGYGRDTSGVYVIDADGSDEHLVLQYARGPSWSANDSRIICLYQGGIYLVDPDGSNLKRIYTSGGTPSMGPDGNVVFTMGGDLYVIDTSGTGTPTLIASALENPHWCSGNSSPPYPPSFDRVFSGVGLIPFTEITDGYATTVPGYMLEVSNAPFGSSINIFGNFELYRNYNIEKYKIQVAQWPNEATPPDPADFVDLQESWKLYVWDSGVNKYVPYLIAADLENKYIVPPAGLDFYIDDMIMRWNTRKFGDGKYTMRMKAYLAGGSELPIPSSINQLVLMVDNSRPEVEISHIIHGTDTVGACSIVYLHATDNLQIITTASDNEGHLHHYNLRAYWGDNEHEPIASEYYNAGTHGVKWYGITDTPFYKNNWPATCAYNFRISARSRATNGYSPNIYYSEYNKLLTLILE